MLFSTLKKLYAMLLPRERLHFYILMVMIMISGLVDMVGVAAVLPFLAALSDPDAIQQSGVLSRIYDIVQPESLDGFLFFLGFMALAVIVLGTLVRTLTMYWLARFSHMRKYHISQRLLASYLRQPYVWFLTRHSSDLVKTVIQEVDQMVGLSLVPAMRILAQAVSILFLLGLLLYVNPIIAISVLLTLGGAYVVIFYFVRQVLTKLGKDRVAVNTARFRITSEALSGVKDVKVMGLESGYLNAYRGPALAHARTLVSVQLIGELPRYALEATTFGGMIVMVLVMMQQGGGMEEEGALAAILPVLGLFAVAGLRILPAVQNIYHSLTSLRAGQAVLDIVCNDLVAMDGQQSQALPPPGIRIQSSAEAGGAVGALPFREMLSIRDLRYRYPGTGRPVLDGVSIDIPLHSTVGIVGGTGAGKTTLIDIILALLEPDSGSILVDGVPVEGDRRRAWQDQIGYVPQQIYLVDDTIAANIAFGVPHDQVDRDAVLNAARLAHLDDFVTTELENGYETFVGERGVRLSGGQRQRIGIARALYHNPEVLIFDEATSALDTVTEDAIIEAVDSLGQAKTIIMIAHRLATVEHCDLICLLENGKVADIGTYNELLGRNTTFMRMARVDVSPAD